MAQERFYFWRGYWEALETLPTDAQRGRFVMAICQYAFAGEVPDLSDDPVLAFAWVVVRDQVAESVEIGRKQSERGSKGGRPRKTTAKSGAKSGAETTAESVRYSNVPSGCAPSQEAQALAAEPRATPERTMDDETARQAALAAIEMLDRMEAMEAGGAPPGAGDG